VIHRLFGCMLTLVTYFFLYGCVNLGPDYSQPDLGIKTPDTYEWAPEDAPTLEVENRWWVVFGDRELNQLVDEVLKNNWDIKLAAARVLEARAQYIRVRADRFPSVNASGLRDRRQIDGGDFRDNFTVDTYELVAPASFEVDLWSRLAKASKVQ
jgi:multidrug efflux system outer membrane protein